MSGPVIGVLALQGDVREHTRVLTGLGARAVAVRRPEELEHLDGIILPGGESTTIATVATAVGLFEPLAARLRAGLPAYGSCAGMILLADRLVGAPAGQRTFGGLDIVVRRNAFGRQIDSFEADVAVPALGDPPLHAVFIRAPWVEEVGEGVEVLGRIATGPAAGRIVAVRAGARVATSFHPELTGDPRVHRLFVDLVRSRA